MSQEPNQQKSELPYRDIPFSIDRKRVNGDEAHAFHAVLAGVCLAGILELSGGAPPENHDVRLSIQLFTVGLIANAFLYIRHYYISEFMERKYGNRRRYPFKEFIVANAFAGPIGAIGAVLHYYRPVICYMYWIGIGLLVHLCSPIRIPKSREDRIFEIVLGVGLVVACFFLWYAPSSTETLIAVCLYFLVFEASKRFFGGPPRPDDPEQPPRTVG